MGEDVTRTRNQWIDVLRGLAILGVVVVHSSQFASWAQSNSGLEVELAFEEFAALGKYGVELFFFVSGYLLASIYGAKAEGVGKRYWISRFARIWPLWAAFFGIYLALGILFDGGPYGRALEGLESEGNQILANPLILTLLSLTFTLWISDALWNTMLPGGWSIQAEVAHYLAFPLARKLSWRRIVLVLACINMATLWVHSQVSSGYKAGDVLSSIGAAWIRLGVFATIGFFILGVLGFLVTKHWSSELSVSQNIRKLKTRDVAMIAAYFGSWLFTPLPWGNNFEGLVFVGLSLLSGILLIKNAFLSQLFQVLGKYSYFIYFAHFMVIEVASIFMRALNVPPMFLGPNGAIALFLVSTVVATMSSTVFAVFSWRYFEAPVIRRAKNWLN